MEFNFGNSRPRSTQLVIQRLIDVHRDFSVPLSTDLTPERLITTFIVQYHSNNVTPIYMHQVGAGAIRPLDPIPSIEILPGQAPVFTVLQEGRQFYELQWLISQLTTQQAQDLIQIPVIVWDLTQWWLLGDANSPTESAKVTLTAFPLPYL